MTVLAIFAILAALGLGHAVYVIGRQHPRNSNRHWGGV